MNNQEAKFILGGYRPGGGDAGDVRFKEALAQARRDPALAAWFAREQAHAATVAAKLAEMTPPAGLRENILAGARASGRSNAKWRSPLWLAVAAGVAIGVMVARWPERDGAKTDSMTEFALVDAAETETHGSRGEAVTTLVRSLSNPATRLAEALPVAFADLAENGCRTLTVQGKPVLEVCFNRKGQWLHCYIARAEDFPDENKRGLIYVTEGGMNAVAWTDGAHRFVVAGAVAREALARLL